MRLEVPHPICASRRLLGTVVHVDRFGNLITNVSAAVLGPTAGWLVQLAGREIGVIRSTFADVNEGAWIAYLGSSGELEIGVRGGNGAARLDGPALGAEVILWRS